MASKVVARSLMKSYRVMRWSQRPSEILMAVRRAIQLQASAAFPEKSVFDLVHSFTEHRKSVLASSTASRAGRVDIAGSGLARDEC